MSRVMRAAGRARSRAKRSERGAALVEAAILMPLVLLLVFGALEFSSMYRDASQVSSAARAGGRIASAEPRVGTMPVDAANAVAAALSGLPSQEPQEVWVFDATNSSTAPAGCGGSCVKFTWNSATKQFNTGGYTPPSWVLTQNACPTGTWAKVGVYVHVKYSYLTGLFGHAGRDLTSTAVFRVEPLGSATCGS
ncbi:MAG TPA: TadE family protein [Acidimicrobiia bacterium]|nr:TadE family protein [Acidimicrobiia bacterium]